MTNWSRFAYAASNEDLDRMSRSLTLCSMNIMAPTTKRLCDSRYKSQEDGFEFSCDYHEGHQGPHGSAEYDSDRDCFREAEWFE